MQVKHKTGGSDRARVHTPPCRGWGSEGFLSGEARQEEGPRESLRDAAHWPSHSRSGWTQGEKGKGAGDDLPH